MLLNLDITNSFQRTFETQQQKDDEDPMWKKVRMGGMITHHDCVNYNNWVHYRLTSASGGMNIFVVNSEH